MRVNDAAAIAARNVLMIGEIFMATSTVFGMIVFVYFAFGSRSSRRHPRAFRSIVVDFRSFCNDGVPYAIDFVVCWYLSFAFEKLIASNRLVVETASKYYYLPSRFALNLFAFVTKHYLFWTQSDCFRIAMFVGNTALMAASEALCNEKHERTATNATLILLFWLTVLILTAPENAYENLRITETFTWKRCSLVYGMVTGVCHNWLKSGGDNSTFDALLFVLVVHVQIVFLCVTYFADGQQLLRNVVGRGTYNPMADSLDIYFTVDSIMSRMSVYFKNKSDEYVGAT